MKMKDFWVRSLTLVIGLMMSACLSGGDDPFEEPPPPPPPPAGSLPPAGLVGNALNGANLYATHCASCHGALASSSKAGASVIRITNALDDTIGVSQMQFINLTDQQIADISAALTGGGAAAFSANKLMVGNRHYLTSLFFDLFTDPSQSAGVRAPVESAIIFNVAAQINAMGGPCRQYDNNGSFFCTEGAEEVSPIPVPDSVRRGYFIRTCEEVLEFDQAVDALGIKSGQNFTVMPTTTTIQNVWGFIFPGRIASSATLNSLMAIATTAQSQGKTVRDAWRFVALAICKSSEMEVL